MTPSIAQAASAHSSAPSAARSFSPLYRGGLAREAVAPHALATNDFDLAVSPSSKAVTPGNTRTASVSTTVTNGASQSLDLTASGLPTGVTATFGTTPIMSGNATSVRFDTANNTAPGSYPIVITATGSGATHSITYTLAVTPASYVRIDDVQVSEGAGTATLTLTRSGDTSGAATVSVATASRTALPGSDYTALPATTVHFAAGDTTATQDVTILNDTQGEPDESFAVRLTGSTGVTIQDDTGNVTILDDDATTFFSIADTTVTEGSSGTTQAAFTITRSGNTSGTSSVTWTTNNGTAVAGSDFTGVPATKVTFAPGETTKTVNVSVNPDTVSETDETFNVRIYLPVNGVLRDDVGTATIVDDDAQSYYSVDDVTTTEGNSGSHNVTFTVTRSGSTTGSGRVSVATANATATAGSDYTALAATPVNFAAGDTTQTVTVPVLGDAVDEPDETFQLKLSSPVGGAVADAAGVATISDDDTTPYLTINDVVLPEGDAGTSLASFTVTRSGNTTAPVSVKYSTANGTASSGSDYDAVALTQLNFAAGETSKTVNVVVHGDTTDEANESFALRLSSPVGATVSDAGGSATIVDDDGLHNNAGPSTFLSAADVRVAEGGGSVTFQVKRTGVLSGTSKVNVATGAASATSGADYTAVPSTQLVFSPGDTVKTVTVPIVQDAIHENDETFNLNLSTGVGATITDYAATATITDDDAPTYVSIADATTTEGDSGTHTVTLTLTRTGNTAVPASVRYSTAGGTATSDVDYVAVPKTPVTFAAGATEATVDITINSDAVHEGRETFTVQLVADPGTTLQDAGSVVTIVDDDAADYLTINDAKVTEGTASNSTATFTVTRTGSAALPASFKYATATGGTATSGADYTAIPATLVTMDAGQTTATVTLTVKADAIDEANETVDLRLTNPVGVSLSDDTGVATIIDDDNPTNIRINDLQIEEGNSGTSTATFTVVRSGVTSNAATVKWATINQTATAGSDYAAVPATLLSFAPGQTTQTVTVTINGDTTAENDETFLVKLTAPSAGVTLTDDSGVGTIESDD